MRSVDKENDLEFWLSKIASTHFKSWDLGLERVKAVGRELGVLRPAPVVLLVGGTNGKGSTCEYLSEFGIRAGLKIGKSTSPHIFRFNERIQVNNTPLPDEQIVNALKLVEEGRGTISLTYFEFSALAAMVCFLSEQVDVAILEVGLGGRLDAMNIVEPELSIITSIAIDHEAWLGRTRDEIGREKAGIMRAGTVCLLGDPDPPRTIIDYAEQLGTPLRRIGKDFELFDGPVNLSRDSFSVAHEAARVLDWNIENGIDIARNTTLLGRNTWLHKKCPILLDIAHNPSAIARLNGYISASRPVGKIHAIFGIYSDKDVQGVIDGIRSVVDFWHLVDSEDSRILEASKLFAFFSIAERSRIRTYDSIELSFAAVERKVSEEDLIVVFGSFFAVSAALQAWN